METKKLSKAVKKGRVFFLNSGVDTMIVRHIMHFALNSISAKGKWMPRRGNRFLIVFSRKGANHVSKCDA